MAQQRLSLNRYLLAAFKNFEQSLNMTQEVIMYFLLFWHVFGGTLSGASAL